MKTKPEPKKMGRPTMPDGERMVSKGIRLTPAQWAKINHDNLVKIRKFIDSL